MRKLHTVLITVLCMIVATPPAFVAKPAKASVGCISCTMVRKAHPTKSEREYARTAFTLPISVNMNAPQWILNG